MGVLSHLPSYFSERSRGVAKRKNSEIETQSRAQDVGDDDFGIQIDSVVVGAEKYSKVLTSVPTRAEWGLLLSEEYDRHTPTFLEVLRTCPGPRVWIVFIGWIAIIIAVLIQECALWGVFFRKIVGVEETSARVRNLALWCVWLVLGMLSRQFVIRRSGQMLPLFLHAEIFVWVSMMMCFVNNLSFYLHTPTTKILFDIGFAVVPEQAENSAWRAVSEVMTVSLPILAALQTAFQTPENRVRSFCDWFRIMSVSFFLRAVTISVTSLPGPAPHCRAGSGEYHPPNDWIDIVSRLQGMYGANDTCGDLIFSGHTTITLTTVLLYLRKLDRFWGPRWAPVRWALGLSYESFILIMMIAGRKHYTVDILVAVIVSTLVFFHFEHDWVPARFTQNISVVHRSRAKEHELWHYQQSESGWDRCAYGLATSQGLTRPAPSFFASSSSSVAEAASIYQEERDCTATSSSLPPSLPPPTTTTTAATPPTTAGTTNDEVTFWSNRRRQFKLSSQSAGGVEGRLEPTLSEREAMGADLASVAQSISCSIDVDDEFVC